MDKAFLVARVDLSTSPPIVNMVSCFSEAEPTIAGNYRQFVVESANGSSFESALDALGLRIRSVPRLHGWVLPLLDNQSKFALGITEATDG